LVRITTSLGRLSVRRGGSAGAAPVSGARTPAGPQGADGRLLFLPKATFQKMLRDGNPGAASMVVYFARMLAGRLDANNRRMMEILDAAARPASSEFSEFKRRLLREWSF